MVSNRLIHLSVLAFAVIFTGSEGNTRDRLSTPVIRIHAVTPAEYDALLQMMATQPYVSEGRLITSGLAALRSLAAGFTNGLTTNMANGLPGLFNNFVNRNSEIIDGNIKDKNSDQANLLSNDDNTRLCVISTDEGAERTFGGGYGNDMLTKTELEHGSSPRPAVNCIVVVKKREGEEIATDQIQSPVKVDEKLQDLNWYPNPYANSYAAARLANMPWYGGDYPPGSPYFSPPPPPPPNFYPFYPYGYAPPPANERRVRRRQKPTSRTNRVSRSLIVPPLRPAYKLSPQQQEQPEEEKRGNVLVESAEQDPDDALSTFEVSNVAYKPVTYPKAGYQSVYPKVAYAHPRFHPAPVYVASPKTPLPIETTTEASDQTH